MQLSKGELVVNPQLELHPQKTDSTVSSIIVRAPVKGWGLKVTTVDRNDNPLFGTLLVHMISGDVPEHLSEAEHQRLHDIGLLIRPDEASDIVWYTCDVLDPPIDDVPRRVRPSVEPSDDLSELIVNPTLRQLGTDGPPASMRGRLKLRNRFSPHRSWLWVQETDLCAPSMYSYAAGAAQGLDQLAAGDLVPDDVNHHVRQRLAAAGIAESARRSAERRTERAKRLATASAELQGHRYTALRHVIAPYQLAAARSYYRTLSSQGYLQPGDAEWTNRLFSSRDPIAHFFHAQLNDLVSEIAGAPLKPSFCFFASYRTGSQLPAHRDREQCEYSMSILVDYAPEPDDVSPWPIFVQPPDASVATPVDLGIGDAVLYFGREVRHHRELLTHSEYCSCWFFFYVPEDFTGSLD